LTDSVLPQNVLNEAEQALNSSILEKSKRQVSYNTFKQWQDLNKVTTVNDSVMLAYFHELVSVRSVSYLFVYAVKET
jgi:hypothetical protein